MTNMAYQTKNSEQMDRLSASPPYEQQDNKLYHKLNSEIKHDEKETKVRIALCIYALLGLALCQVSKMNLNVSIVEMVHHTSLNNGLDDELDGSCPHESQIDYYMRVNSSRLHHQHNYNISNDSDTTHLECSNNDCNHTKSTVETEESFDEIIHNATNDTTESLMIESNEKVANDTRTEEFLSTIEDDPSIMEYPTYEWSSKQQSFLLGAFYIGYAPFMILGGVLAEKYGNKYMILLSVAGSGLVNFLTPFLASFSFEMLILSRIVLGVMQAAIFPSLYDLFSKWLTMTETSMFAPMIKVAFSLGTLLGSLLPGVIISLELGWPMVFYVSGYICTIWAAIWWYVGDSTPQQSRFVRLPELNRIIRKKNIAAFNLYHTKVNCSPVDTSTKTGTELSTKSNNSQNSIDKNNSNCCDNQMALIGPKKRLLQLKEATPWKLILTSPSVLSLILVKFTYQLCLDFASIELANYLKNTYHAPVEIISTITVAMFAIQVLFIAFVGMLAKNMVRDKTFGWSKTATRKVFQGLANFSMAIMYVSISYTNCNLTMVVILLQMISIAYMFGAGGETMLPYDLSEKYPATIVGIGQSGCAVSGLVMALLTGQILGDRGNDNVRWNLLLRLVAGASFVGGLVFTLVAKAEPIEGKQEQNLMSKVSNGEESIEATTSVRALHLEKAKKRQLTTKINGLYRVLNSSSPSEVIVKSY